jgi:hypothetical protein
VVIRRRGFSILEINLVERSGEYRCKFCDAKIPIKGRIMPTWREEFRFVYVPIQTFAQWRRREVNK